MADFLYEVRAACGCLAFVMVDDELTWKDAGKDLARAAAKFGAPIRVAKGDSAPWKCPAHPNAGIREATGKWKPPKPTAAPSEELGL